MSRVAATYPIHCIEVLTVSRENPNHRVVLNTNGDGEATWHEVLVVSPDGNGAVRTRDPEFWMVPSGMPR